MSYYRGALYKCLSVARGNVRYFLLFWPGRAASRTMVAFLAYVKKREPSPTAYIKDSQKRCVSGTTHLC